MSESEPTRRARLERGRNRRRHGIAAAGTVLAIVVATLGVGAWRARGSDTSPDAATIPSATSTTVTVPEKLAKVVGHTPPRPLSHDDPLRIWVGGDSLAGELGPTLGNQLGSTGIVKTTVDFKVGSGLHATGLRNWPERVPSQMAEYQPDVAIFMIGANDASIVGSSDAWMAPYRAKVSEMMDELGGATHRTVYWVGPPTMGSASLDRGAKALGALMADEAHHHQHVVYVDAYTMFSGPNGGFSSHLDLPALHATDVRVRIGDGVHFTNSGAEWIAYNVSRLLDEQWQITAQAGGASLDVTVESGGGSIPGYRRPTYHPRTHPTSTAAPPSSAVGSSSTPVVTAPPSTVGHPPTSPSSTPHTTVSHPPTSAPPPSSSPPST